MTDLPERRRIHPVAIAGAAVAVVGAGVYFLTHAGDQEPSGQAQATQTRQALAVTVARVETRTFARRMPLAGEARPRDDVRVFAPSAGIRVLEVLADEGDVVRQGQPLARLDQALAGAQTQSADAQVARAEAGLKEAEAGSVRAAGDFERANAIRDTGALSAEALASRRAAADAAGARLDAARAELAAARAARAALAARLGGGYLRAPRSGLVINRTVQPGQMADGQALFRIAGDNRLEVAAEVAEADILALQKGQPAKFFLVDGSEISATLRRPPAAIDSRTRTGSAVFDLPRDARLRAGMFLRGETRLAPREALAVPASAVLYDGPETVVYVVDQDNRARRTVVVAGVQDREHIAIERGLARGQTVVAGGGAFLADGDIVRPVAPQVAAPDVAQVEAEGRGG